MPPDTVNSAVNNTMKGMYSSLPKYPRAERSRTHNPRAAAIPRAIRKAAIRLVGSATPRPAMS